MEGEAWMEYIIGGLWSGLELLASLFFSGAFLSRREKKWYQPLLFLSAWIFVCVYTNLELNRMIMQILSIMVYAALSCVVHDGKWYLHILLALISYLFLLITDALVVNGMCALLHLSYNQLMERMWLFITLTTIDKTIAVFLAWLLGKIRHRRDFGSGYGKWLVLSILFPLVSTLLFAVLFCSLPTDEDVSLVIVIFSGVLLIANAAMLYVVSAIEKAAEQEQNTRILRRQISMQSQSYRSLEESYTAQRRMTHEFERHMQVLNDLLEEKEYHTARDYVQRLRNNRSLHLFHISTHNPVVDALLNQKYQLAKDQNIAMHIEVNDLSALPIPSDELVVVLANLLDNAIEACMKVDGEREILCSMIMENSVYLAISNSTPPVQIVGNEIATTKANAMEHGFGLPAVKLILEKLHAEYTFDYSKGVFQFVAEIPCESRERKPA